MAAKLTKAQRAALIDIELFTRGGRETTALGIPIKTLAALKKRKLIKSRYVPFHLEYSLTDAGRAALAAKGADDE